MSSVIAAAKRLAIRQPGGISGLAELMGVNPTTFSHKLNREGSANLFATELERMTELTVDPEIAQALAYQCNHICIPILPRLPDDDLDLDVVTVAKEFGDLMAATKQAIADGKVTNRELAHYDQQLMEFIGAAMALRGDLKKRIPASPPEIKIAR